MFHPAALASPNALQQVLRRVLQRVLAAFSPSSIPSWSRSRIRSWRSTNHQSNQIGAERDTLSAPAGFRFLRDRFHPLTRRMNELRADLAYLPATTLARSASVVQGECALRMARPEPMSSWPR